MMRKSIAAKLFIMVFLSFVTFLAVTIICQTFFFKKFYIQDKQKKVITAMDSFASNYKKHKWKGSTLDRKINAFIYKNESLMAIIDKNGVIKKINDLEINIKTSKNKNVVIPLKNISNCEQLQKLNFFMGKNVNINGKYIGNKEKYFQPFSIDLGNMRWDIFSSIARTNNNKKYDPSTIIMENKNSKYSFSLKLKDGFNNQRILDSVKLFNLFKDSITLKGHISYIDSLNSENTVDPYKMNLLLSSISSWLKNSSSSNYYKSKDSFFAHGSNKKDNKNTENNIVFVKGIKSNNNQEFIFVMESLKSANEVFEVMGQYYIYVFFIAFLIILILAMIFAKAVTKPLIKINAATLKMSKMDFSEMININSKDEIGTLSQSINTLSENLKNNIDMLKAANEKLTADIERERNLEKVRKEFVAAASHELKTPLSIIEGFTEGIIEGISKEKQGHYLDVILKETHKMNSLVMDMLELSKLESGNYAISIEAFDIINLIHKIANSFAHLIEEKELSIVYNFSCNNISVNADKARIEAALINILSNSLRHTWQKHCVYITVTLEDATAAIIIENEGDKIPEDKLDKVWDRFYRVEESRNKSTGGTGLGLSIVKNILELHKSEYGISNTERGVKYYFTLHA